MKASRRGFFQGAATVALAVPAALTGAHAQRSESQAVLPADAAQTDRFIRLSQTLTGLPSTALPHDVQQTSPDGTRMKLADVYLRRLLDVKEYEADVRALLDLWNKVENDLDPEVSLTRALRANGAAAERLRVAARQVIKIWYLSTIDDPKRPLSDEGLSQAQLGGDVGQYENSAIWPLIGAPVPGYSNRPHGFWAHKPDLR